MNAQRTISGFTFIEIMISAGLMSLVVLVFLACYMASQEFAEFVRPKIQNTQYARESLGPLMEEIRSANSVQVGTGTVSSFTIAASGKPQAGNAIRIYPTTNLSQYIYYYQDPTNNLLMKMSLSSTIAVTNASGVTHRTPFAVENFTGTVLTNAQDNCVLSILLRMRRDSRISGISDNYQLRTKVTRRNIL